MSDFYYARYEHLSHRELYDTVRAGDPSTLDQVATRWFTMGNTAGSLSTDLQRDLAALAHTWHGSAGAEFQRRLLSVAQFSDTLAAEFDGLHTNAKYLASRLREAQSKAEDPAATDDNDKMSSGAMNGAAIGPATTSRTSAPPGSRRTTWTGAGTTPRPRSSASGRAARTVGSARTRTRSSP